MLMQFILNKCNKYFNLMLMSISWMLNANGREHIYHDFSNYFFFPPMVNLTSHRNKRPYVVMW